MYRFVATSALPLISPLQLAELLLTLCNTQVWVQGRHLLPPGPAIIISNHRSFLDAPLLMAALGRPIQFACHYYLTQVPGLREIVQGLGCIPLKQGCANQVHFFRQAEHHLHQCGSIGIFPEGARQITRGCSPAEMASFQAGFAHLAYRSHIDPLPIIPVSIQVQQEWLAPPLPLALFRWVDPTEPMFQGEGSHPVVIYEDVSVTIGKPLWVRQEDRAARGAEKQRQIHLLTDKAYQTVQENLRHG